MLFTVFYNNNKAVLHDQPLLIDFVKHNSTLVEIKSDKTFDGDDNYI